MTYHSNFHWKCFNFSGKWSIYWKIPNKVILHLLLALLINIFFWTFHFSAKYLICWKHFSQNRHTSWEVFRISKIANKCTTRFSYRLWILRVVMKRRLVVLVFVMKLLLQLCETVSGIVWFLKFKLQILFLIMLKLF